ncbi:TIGR01777 family oxidoreductase [Flavobacterium sp. ASW18X]|uniref:TIGR01777 family oxidoreductase n=1 Tax=Flavobacterium sp. ASW18X TaxID=2572595 RepID=UPI0010AE2E38|nr:TIGR01777 family oxidoreductase [Flavobacterium sp. ASW18X]TKD61372.1 TIGR01777 family protein [Flavobacterium sp. ASW18X]
MKVLITGATGLVGQAIVKELKKKSVPIHYLTTSKNKIETENGYKGFYWNPANLEMDMAALDGVTDIINLAGASISKRWKSSYKKEIIDSRINSLKTLKKGIELVGDDNLIGFVSASAIGIYTDSLTNLYDVDETTVDDSFLGEVVKLWEEEIKTFQKFDINVSMVRIGLVLSKDGGALPQIEKPVQNYVGAAFGSGEQWQSWIHIQDLAELFVFILKHQLKGVFNGVAPNPVTNSKMTKELANVLQKPLWLPNIPKLVMRVVLGEMSYILFASQRVSSRRIEEEGFLFNYANICAALRNIYDAPKPEPKLTEKYEETYS